MTLTLLDRTGSAYPVTATFLADGRPHVLVGSLGDKALYPIRVASITVTFGQPAARRPRPRLHPARPLDGRLDAAGDLARPD